MAMAKERILEVGISSLNESFPLKPPQSLEEKQKTAEKSNDAKKKTSI